MVAIQQGEVLLSEMDIIKHVLKIVSVSIQLFLLLLLLLSMMIEDAFWKSVDASESKHEVQAYNRCMACMSNLVFMSE